MGEFPVANIIELVGSSNQSWEDAVRQAVREAAKTVQNIRGIEVLNMTANVNGGQVNEYKVDMHLSFGVDNRLRNIQTQIR